ncbi:hypothetical protein [Anaeromyxobacter paludicola]|uniref:Uncharacterized protein n=1 Tax=Anaeromyxobacter paludicola TaxID=2918171 RepID=A0ABM7X9L7_9BACT|nr:hypothetical protein [Anaeromyxobacter paludicola]BDG08534.1 hypothetical protein AMPC_16470 [Anaeromyxobacter paludicola]
MDLDLTTVLGVLALTALAVLLTGPGLWSESWGWWMLGDRKRRGARQADGRPPAPRDAGAPTDRR